MVVNTKFAVKHINKIFCLDTSAYDSIVANQKELKKAQLVDDLNEKIFKRPGVFELVEKNIIPADDTVAEALKGILNTLLCRKFPHCYSWTCH